MLGTGSSELAVVAPAAAAGQVEELPDQHCVEPVAAAAAAAAAAAVTVAAVETVAAVVAVVVGPAAVVAAAVHRTCQQLD